MKIKRNLSLEDFDQLQVEDGASNNQKSYDVVIVGNGPSAIILSHFLSGYWPYYNGQSINHPVLEERLKCCSQKKSLIFEDLEWLSDGLYDSRTVNPVSILFDHLLHPNADLLARDDTAITWRYHPEKAISHIVLGLGPAGGSWHRMANTQLTVSLSHWLELPGMTFSSWLKRNEKEVTNIPNLTRVPGVHHARTNATYLGMYYSDYVEEMDLSQNFLNNVFVESIMKVDDENAFRYKLEGVQYTGGGNTDPVGFTAKNVVLACGANSKPRMLGIPGESNPFVTHSLPDPEMLHKCCPVVVVGCGLTALDAVLALINREIPVVHVFRRDAKDQQLIVNQLSSAYADYIQLKPYMIGRQVHKFYTPYPKHNLVEILSNKQVVIEHVSKNNPITLTVSKVIVQIGSVPDLSIVKGFDDLLEEPDRDFSIKENPIEVNMYTHESMRYPGLYALGPLVGDNFVRFISGGALAITHGLFSGDSFPSSGAATVKDIPLATRKKSYDSSLVPYKNPGKSF